jgi:signal transduction histidine kinase
VAQGVPAATVFAAVSEEVAKLYGEDLAAVGRYAADGSYLTVVGVASEVEWLAVGSRLELTEFPETPAAIVYATSRSARVDWSAATSEAARLDATGRSERVDWSVATSDFGRSIGIVSSVACPIIVEGRLWGAVGAMATTRPLPVETELRLERFSDLLATAIANAESKSELAASRRRIVAATDEARRRIERDLHDGTQQRLVALGLAVRNAEADVPEGCDQLRSELSRVARGLTDAVTELQEMSRGIHPAILSQGGLAAALRALARRFGCSRPARHQDRRAIS